MRAQLKECKKIIEKQKKELDAARLALEQASTRTANYEVDVEEESESDDDEDSEGDENDEDEDLDEDLDEVLYEDLDDQLDNESEDELGYELDEDDDEGEEEAVCDFSILQTPDFYANLRHESNVEYSPFYGEVVYLDEEEEEEFADLGKYLSDIAFKKKQHVPIDIITSLMALVGYRLLKKKKKQKNISYVITFKIYFPILPGTPYLVLFSTSLLKQFSKGPGITDIFLLQINRKHI